MVKRILRRLARAGGGADRLASIGHLLTGNFANAVLMLIATTIAARDLGPVSYGVFAMILTIGHICERLVRFESWQPLIKFAADEEVTGDPERQAQLFRYGLLLDVGSALFGAAIAILSSFFLMPLLGLKSEHLVLITIYAIALAVNIRGMPSAALRLAGQFRTIAYLQMASSLLRIVLAAAALFRGAELLDFVVIWTVSQILDSLLFQFLGFRALSKLGIPSPLAASTAGMVENFPGFMRFAWSTNISSGLRTLTQEADTLLVGAVAGSASAGFYYLAKRIAKAAEQVAAQVQAVLYPDMARLWARAEIDRFRNLTARIQMSLAIIGLAMLAAIWLLGHIVIATFFGEAYVSAYPLLVAQLIAVVLMMHAAPSRSALLAMNMSRTILVIALISTALFFVVAYFAIPKYGALGASCAHIAFGTLTACAMDIVWWRQSRRGPPPAGEKA